MGVVYIDTEAAFSAERYHHLMITDISQLAFHNNVKIVVKKGS